MPHYPASRHSAIPSWPVFTDGMALLASHFQQIVRSAEAQSVQLCSHSNAAHGVITLRLRDELTSGMLGIEQCEAVLPDGTLVRIPETDECEKLTGLIDALGPGDLGQVWLTTGQHRQAPMVTANASDVARFRRVERAVDDDFDAGREPDQIEVLLRQVNLRLTVGNASGLSPQLSALPLAQIECNRGKQLRLRMDFVPPCLSILPVQTSPHFSELRALIDDMLARIQSNARQLSRLLATMNHPAGIDLDLLRKMMRLQALVPQYEVLSRCFAAPGTHPATLHLEFVRLIEALRAVSLAVTAESPLYNHRSLYESFAALRPLLEQLLDQRAASDYKEYTPKIVALPQGYQSQANQGILYQVDIDTAHIQTRHLLLEFQVADEIAQSDAVSHLSSQKVKIATVELAPQLSVERIDGPLCKAGIWSSLPKEYGTRSWVQKSCVYVSFSKPDPKSGADPKLLRAWEEVRATGRLGIFVAHPVGPMGPSSGSIRLNRVIAIL